MCVDTSVILKQETIMALLEKSLLEARLKTFIDPHSETDLITAKAVKSLEIVDKNVHLNLVLGYPAASYLEELKNAVQQHLQQLPEVGEVTVEVTVNIVSHAVQQNLKPQAGIKNIIAVASGKGGVGKSTTAINLALALSAEGARVGILDADIYGPSIPMMLGLSGLPETENGKVMLPKIGHGIQSISIGYLINQDEPMIWRGPMVTGALQQLLRDTRWDALDYLIIDLPPGTGDIQLTLAQQIPVSGAVIVTTPQDIALLDAQRGLGMFQKVNVPVLGVIENMSVHICSHCGHEEAIFGAGGGATMAEKNQLPLLGALPLDSAIRQNADSGNPTVIAQPESRAAQMYGLIARKMAARLALKGKDFSSRFPNIVIENN